VEKPHILIQPQQLTRIFGIQQLVDEFHSSDLSIRSFAKQRGIPDTTLRRHIKAAGKGPEALIDKRSSASGRRTVVQDDVLLWVLAYTTYHRRATLANAYRELSQAAPRLGWKIPAYSTIARSVSLIPSDIRAQMVSGSKASFEKWGIVRTNNTDVVNAMWQVDACELPLWALDPVGGQIFKPWLVGYIDCCSRVAMRMKVFRKAPDSAAVITALRDAILPTNDDRFPYMGRPQAIQSDNGSIFTGSDYLDCLLRLGIQHKRIRNDCPSSNGKVERLFQTLQNQLCRHLLQYSEQYRGLAAARRQPLPYSVIQELVDDWASSYHLTEHRTLGTTPWKAWHDHLIEAPGFDISAPEVVDACRIRITRQVRRDGIEYGTGRHYSSPELAGLVGESVTLRVLPWGEEGPIPCYYKGDQVAALERVEGNLQLADQIKAARLERAKSISKLRKSLLKTAERILPEQHAKLPSGEKVITPKPSTELDEQQPLDIPDLETIDE